MSAGSTPIHHLADQLESLTIQAPVGFIVIDAQSHIRFVNRNQIEAYIRDHSEANFSHGICPECAHSLYPELDLPDD